MNSGTMILRVEDLDPQRCRPEFCDAIIPDLSWFGLRWDEGPDVGGTAGPYSQSERQDHYLDAWTKLRDAGLIYPCRCSRKDVLQTAVAPHDEDEEPIYPGTCRPVTAAQIDSARNHSEPQGVHWRFQVPDGEELRFRDERLGEQQAVAGTPLAAVPEGRWFAAVHPGLRRQQHLGRLPRIRRQLRAG